MPTIFDALMMQIVGDISAAAAAAPSPVADAAGPREPRSFRFMRIDVEHGYAEGVFGGIAILPTHETVRRLTSFGFVARPRIGGIDILWDDVQQAQANALLAAKRTRDGALPDALRTAIFEPPLLFEVRAADARFANYTAMPTTFRIGDPPLLLSNRHVTTGEARHAVLDVDWQRRVDREEGQRTLRLKAYLRLRASRQPPAVSPAARAGDAMPTIRPLPAIDEREAVIAHSQALALLDLHLVRPVDEAAPAGGWDGLPVDFTPAQDDAFFRACSYTLRFEARTTRWRYLVAAREGALAVDDLSVVDADDAEPFVLERERRILPDGRSAACFTARDPLPILARPAQRFALVGLPLGGRVRRRRLVDPLPVADADAIQPQMPPPTVGEPPPAWSDIYVFL